MTTLADIRDRTRTDLHDTDPASQRWTDAELDRHIAHALSDLSLAIPRELTATIATTPGSRELSVAPLSGLLEVEYVEHPAGHFPPCRVRFTRWGDTLLLQMATAPDGSGAAISYVARHTLDGTGSTLPAQFEDLLVMGATAYAALEQSAAVIDRLNTGGAAVPGEYGDWARARLTAFGQLLRQRARANRVRARILISPAF